MMAASADPELAFVLACVRRDAGATAARALAAEAVGDWRRVADLARQHDVPWWVVRALPSESVPSEVCDALRDEMRDLARRAMAGTRELLAVLQALSRGGVRALAFKGPALAADVHGDLAARRFTDLDILIAKRDRAAARRALAAAGYRAPAGFTEREARFYHAWEGVDLLELDASVWPVELHWRCHARRYGAPQDPAPLFATARTMALGGAEVLVPGSEELAALLALHGVKHAWRSLLWVADFGHAVQRDGFDWMRLAAIATEWSQACALHTALLVAHEVLEVPVPVAMRDRARADHRAARLAGAAVSALRGEVATEDVGRESTARYDLQWLGGAWPQVRYVMYAASLPTTRERQALRLPDALLPLAFPVRALRLLRRALGGGE
jgi:hypothetical protein